MDILPLQELLATDSFAFVVHMELGHFSTSAMHKVQKEVMSKKKNNEKYTNHYERRFFSQEDNVPMQRTFTNICHLQGSVPGHAFTCFISHTSLCFF